MRNLPDGWWALLALHTTVAENYCYLIDKCHFVTLWLLSDIESLNGVLCIRAMSHILESHSSVLAIRLMLLIIKINVKKTLLNTLRYMEGGRNSKDHTDRAGRIGC